MPSSYADSIPSVIHMLVAAKPHSVVDIGPGWGKYGLMAREYIAPVRVDAIEVEQGRLPTQACLYDRVLYTDVRSLDEGFWRGSGYDVALMIDVIEHMPKPDGQQLLRRIIDSGIEVLVVTPTVFFEQDPGPNPHEAHLSFWSAVDLAQHGTVLDNRSTPDATILLLG